MIIVDASVVVDMLTGVGADGRAARKALGRDGTWIAPEHLVVEACNSIRKQLGRGDLAKERAVWALDRLTHLRVRLLPIQPLLRDIWRLRHNATAYDAAYIVSATRFDCTLVTADKGVAAVARTLGVTVERITSHS